MSIYNYLNRLDKEHIIQFMENYIKKAADAFLVERPYGMRVDYRKKGFVLFNRNLNVLGNAEQTRLEELPLERFNVEEIPLEGEVVEEHAGFTDVFFYTDLTTGLRRGEICGLMWRDFDGKAGTLKVCRTLHSKKLDVFSLGDTKTGMGTRTIVLPHSTLELLRQRKKNSISQWIFHIIVWNLSRSAAGVPGMRSGAMIHILQRLRSLSEPWMMFLEISFSSL